MVASFLSISGSLSHDSIFSMASLRSTDAFSASTVAIVGTFMVIGGATGLAKALGLGPSTELVSTLLGAWMFVSSSMFLIALSLLSSAKASALMDFSSALASRSLVTISRSSLQLIVSLLSLVDCCSAVVVSVVFDSPSSSTESGLLSEFMLSTGLSGRLRFSLTTFSSWALGSLASCSVRFFLLGVSCLPPLRLLAELSATAFVGVLGLSTEAPPATSGVSEPRLGLLPLATALAD